MSMSLPSDVDTGNANIPIVKITNNHKIGGIDYLMTNAADIAARATLQRTSITQGLYTWAQKARIRASDEPASRLWTQGTGGNDAANSAASHARTVEFAPGKTADLVAETNIVRASTGIPASGIGANGDLAFDVDTGVVYKKTAGAWAFQLATRNGKVNTTVTISSPLPLDALFGLTPINSGSATVQTLPAAAAAFAAKPFGSIVLQIVGAGVPTFAKTGSDTLDIANASTGFSGGKMAATVVSATKWVVQ